MPDELPPLDKFVVSTFSAGDLAWPVVVMARDNRAAGYEIPAVDSACPDPLYTGHVFIGVTPTNIDNRVLWTWELLPGPWIPFTRWDLLLGPIQGRRRAVRNTGQTSTLTATVKKTYEGRDGSSIVSWEIEETNSNGTGSGSNPAFPILTDDIYDDLKGPVQRVSQVVVATGSEAGSLAVNAGTGLVTEIRYEAVNEFLLNKITETWTAPGPAHTTQRYEPISDTYDTIAKTLKITSLITEAISLITATNPDTIQTVESQAYNELLSFEVVTTQPQPAALDSASQITIAEEVKPFQMPATLDITWYAATDGFIGHNKAFVRRVPHLTKVFWVFSATKPTLTLDIPILSSVFSLLTGEDNLGEMIMNADTLHYTGADVAYPASTPTRTTYLADWVGTTGARPVAGDVRMDPNKYRWRVERVYVQFLVQPQPTIS